MVWVSREEISVGEYVDSFGSIRVRKEEWDNIKSKWKKIAFVKKKKRKFKMLTLYKKKVEKQDEKGLVMCLNEVGRDWS